MIAQTVYLLCAATSVLCTVLLVKAYWGQKNHLLLAVAICFSLFAVNNLLLFANLFYPNTQFLLIRAIASLVGLLVLVYGLIKEATI